MPAKATDVLFVGMSRDAWLETKSDLKGAMQSMDMAWSYISNPAPTFAEAVDIVQKRPSLEIVQISNESNLSQGAMVKGCQILAEALSRHPKKPWVMLGINLEYLKPVFENKGICVASGYTPFVIHARWILQTKGMERCPKV